MAALTADRDTDRMISAHDQVRMWPIAATVKIYRGALVVVNASGKSAPGTTATTHRICAGRARNRRVVRARLSARTVGFVVASVRQNRESAV